MDDKLQILTEIFEEAGVYFASDKLDEKLELDSLHYVSIICDIEDHFDIEIPDEYLTTNPLLTLNDFLQLIDKQKNVD